MASARAVDEDAEAEEQPASTGPPAGEREDAEDGREQQQVAERVGEVRRDGRRRAFCGPQHELDEHRRAERGRRERRGQAVEPERPADRASSCAEQRNHSEIRQRIEADEADIADRRERLGMDGRVPDLTEDPARHRRGECRPGSALARDEEGSRTDDDAGQDQEPVVEPDIEEGLHVATWRGEDGRDGKDREPGYGGRARKRDPSGVRHSEEKSASG